MKKKEKYNKLDIILNAFKGKNKVASTISREVKMDFHIFHTLSIILLENGYIKDFNELATKSEMYQNDFIATISQKGIYFFELEGGFKRRYKQERQKYNWTIAKTSAAIANAVIIICISIWAIIESKKEPGTEKLEKEIELLKKKVEKMNFIKKDTLKINNLN